MADTKPPPLELTREQHDALIGELGDLWQVVYGCSYDCFCGSNEDLVRTVRELREKARGMQDQERE